MKTPESAAYRGVVVTISQSTHFIIGMKNLKLPKNVTIPDLLAFSSVFFCYSSMKLVRPLRKPPRSVEVYSRSDCFMQQERHPSAFPPPHTLLTETIVNIHAIFVRSCNCKGGKGCKGFQKRMVILSHPRALEDAPRVTIRLDRDVSSVFSCLPILSVRVHDCSCLPS